MYSQRAVTYLKVRSHIRNRKPLDTKTFIINERMFEKNRRN